MATNNLSAQKVVLDLLRFIGVVGFTPAANDQALNQPGLDDDDTRKAIAAVNSALQTVQKHGPQNLKQGERSASYVAPATITLTINPVTNAKLATASVAPPARMLGCSILIDGDAEINRITAITGTFVSLLRGYLGAAGTISATVYSDCAALDDDVATVLEPVQGSGNLLLYPADITEFERLRHRCWDYGWPSGYGLGGTIQSIAAVIGAPARYLVERQRGGIPLLRIAPIPPSAMNVTFQAKLRAERITVAVLDLTGVTDPAYYFTSLHDDDVESVLLPIARWRFCSGHPAVKNMETSNRLEKEYTEVMTMLKNGGLLESSVATQRVRYI